MKTEFKAQAASGDLVLQQLWRAKDELSAAYDHDLDKLFAGCSKREEQSGHPLVTLPQRAGKPAAD